MFALLRKTVPINIGRRFLHFKKGPKLDLKEVHKVHAFAADKNWKVKKVEIKAGDDPLKVDIKFFTKEHNIHIMTSDTLDFFAGLHKKILPDSSNPFCDVPRIPVWDELLSLGLTMEPLDLHTTGKFYELLEFLFQLYPDRRYEMEEAFRKVPKELRDDKRAQFELQSNFLTIMIADHVTKEAGSVAMAERFPYNYSHARVLTKDECAHVGLTASNVLYINGVKSAKHREMDKAGTDQRFADLLRNRNTLKNRKGYDEHGIFLKAYKYSKTTCAIHPQRVVDQMNILRDKAP